MSTFKFTGTISELFVVESELDAMFADLEDFLNLPTLNGYDIEASSIDYRHIKYQPRIGLARFDTTGAPTITLPAFSGYYVVDETVLAATSSVSDMDNEVKSTQGVVHVEAWIGIADQGNNGTPVQEACIGYSTDGGLTYTPLDTGTGRPFGQRCNGIYTDFFDGPSAQPHYMSGIVGYSPSNSLHDHYVIMCGSFGGEKSLQDPSTITHYCVMIDSSTVGNCQPFWWIELNMRDRVT